MLNLCSICEPEILGETVRQTDTQTEVVQFVADKGILSANLCESVSK